MAAWKTRRVSELPLNWARQQKPTESSQKQTDMDGGTSCNDKAPNNLDLDLIDF
jgi:hypothetical protein